MKAAIALLVAVGVLGASFPLVTGPHRDPAASSAELVATPEADAGAPSEPRPQASGVPPLDTLEARLKASAALKRGEFDHALDELEIELARVRMLINGGK